jgi:Uma2 family endonuclease
LPHTHFGEGIAKAMEYLSAGVKQVWLVSPEHHTVTIYRSATHITALAGDGELVSEDLFPGFRCPLREIFASPGQTPPLPRQQA